MHTATLSGSIESVAAIDDDDDTVAIQRPAGLAWTQLPRIAQAYVLVVGDSRARPTSSRGSESDRGTFSPGVRYPRRRSLAALGMT